MKTWKIEAQFKNAAGERQSVEQIRQTDDIDREIILIKNTIKMLGGQYLGVTYRVKE